MVCCKILNLSLVFLLVFYRCVFVECSVRLLNPNVNASIDSQRNEPINFDYKFSKDKVGDTISEFGDYKLLREVLSDTREAQVNSHNNSKPLFKYLSPDDAKTSSSFKVPLTKSTLTKSNKSKSQQSKYLFSSKVKPPKFTLKSSSDDPIDSFLSSGIRVVTLKITSSTSSDTSSKPKENNLDDFDIKKYAHVIECKFKPDVQCSEVSYEGKTVWKFGDHGINSYPKLLRFDLVAKPMIDFQFEDKTYISFVYRNFKWKVRSKKLSSTYPTSDLTNSELSSEPGPSNQIPEPRTEPEAPKSTRKVRTYSFDRRDEEESEEQIGSNDLENKKVEAQLLSSEKTDSNISSTASSKLSESNETNPDSDVATKTLDSKINSNDNSLANALLKKDKFVFEQTPTSAKSDKIEELEQLKQLEEFRESQRTEELVRQQLVEPEEPEELDLKKHRFKFEKIIPENNVKIYTWNDDSKTKLKEIDPSEYELEMLGDDFLRYKFKDDAKCLKIEYNDSELWHYTDKKYDNDLKEFDICGRTKTAIVSFGDDLMNVYKYQNGGWDTLISGKVRPVTLDVSKKASTDEFEYSGDKKKKIGTYNVKEGFVINSIIQSTGLFGTGDIKVIWNAADHTEYVVKVVIDGISGSETRNVFVKELTGDILHYVKQKDNWREKPISYAVDLDLNEPTDLNYFERSEDGDIVEFVPRKGVLVRSVSFRKLIWHANNPNEYAQKIIVTKNQISNDLPVTVTIFQSDGLVINFNKSPDKNEDEEEENKEELEVDENKEKENEDKEKSKELLKNKNKNELKVQSEDELKEDLKESLENESKEEWIRTVLNEEEKEKLMSGGKNGEKLMNGTESVNDNDKDGEINGVMNTLRSRDSFNQSDVQIKTDCGSDYEGEQYVIRMGLEGTTYSFPECHCTELDYLGKRLWTHKGNEPFPVSINFLDLDKAVIVRFEKKFLVYRRSAGKWRGLQYEYPIGEKRDELGSAEPFKPKSSWKLKNIFSRT